MKTRLEHYIKTQRIISVVQDTFNLEQADELMHAGLFLMCIQGF